MAYIVLTANGEEIDRRELRAALVVGRAAGCDVAVHDILMSRRHCRIEPAGRGWRAVDLGSKNGTRLGWDRVESRMLGDGDVLRVGRTMVRYCAGAYEAPPEGTVRTRTVRPADPLEALTGTVSGFVYREQETGTERDEPVSPELAALADSTLPPDLSPLMRRHAGTLTLEAPAALGTRRAARAMPVPNPHAAQARRAAYLRRLEDVSLQATAPLIQPSVPPSTRQRAQTDWKLVAMLLGGCVVTLAVAFVLKP